MLQVLTVICCGQSIGVLVGDGTLDLLVDGSSLPSLLLPWYNPQGFDELHNSLEVGSMEKLKQLCYLCRLSAVDHKYTE